MKAFEVQWADADVARMLDRVAGLRLPDVPEGASWAVGCDPVFLRRFRDYWIHHYDWRGAMATLNRYPQFTTMIDDQEIHFVHLKGEGAAPRPLLLTHGWPGSHYEFWGVAERLAFPSRFGGAAADAYDLVIPSLPGYGFSGKPKRFIGPKTTAKLWHRLMTEVLGYPEYLAQGGDWGGVITSLMGLNAPKGLRGIHLNMLALRSNEPPQNEAEKDWMARAAQAYQDLSGYSLTQKTKPLSLTWGLADNPLGQAAWILERFHDWSDLRHGDIESVFGLDHLITNVMIYVMNDRFASSIWFYHAMVLEGGFTVAKGERCETPTAYAAFPMDAVLPASPRSRGDLCYNITRWTDFDRGGHFAAMEQPDLFVGDVQAWGREIWPAA